jgi:sugar phosphate isomerase/epimerase
MPRHLNRRTFFELAAAAALPATAGAATGRVERTPGNRVKIALNAYSFNRPLMDGSMTLADAVRYCAELGLEGLDATGYYFPGYPKVPTDEAIYALKRTAFVNGVALTGTGVRNDFTLPDAAARQRDIQLVKDWVVVASKLGAPVVRVFSGPRMPANHTFDQVLQWMIPAFQECAAFGREHGVVIGLQHHNDFLKTAAETIRVIEAVDSPWFGNILDIGSLRTGDPYEEIARLLPYAVSWQLKEKVGYGTKEVATDLRRVKAIVDKGGFRGFMPIETLGAGDPKVKMAAFLAEVRKVFAA